MTLFDPYFTEGEPKSSIDKGNSENEIVDNKFVDPDAPNPGGNPLKVDVYTDGYKLNSTAITVTATP